MNVHRQANVPDIRRFGSHPDYWYPVARSKQLRTGKPLAITFAGDPIVIVRTQSGKILALEDRCSHRQVPLSAGVVAGDFIRCGYHGWTFDGSGRCIGVPYLNKGEPLPCGVRSYPLREAYGFLFVYPGNPIFAADRFPLIESRLDSKYKTRILDRQVRCHYSFMHENLLDMNHQFLHRSLMGNVRPTLLELTQDDDWLEAVYTFSRVGGRQSLGEKFMLGKRAGAVQKREHDVMTIRTQYPYQILRFIRADQDRPALDLWLAYVPVDREQRINRSMGFIMIQRPGVPGLIELAWPFITWFTNGIFAQDKWIMELEQQAWDRQGGDWNNEIFHVVHEVRQLLMRNGRPLDAQTTAEPETLEV